MKTFKAYLNEEEERINEMAMLSQNPEEYEFLKRVMSRTNLEFLPGDFENTKFKRIIQQLIAAKWFHKAKDIKTSSAVDLKNLKTGIAQLKSIDKKAYEKLFSYKPKGSNPGPGEVVLYFLIDKAVIAGDNSRGIDLIVGSTEYEVKGAKVGAKHGLYGFQTGGTVSDTDIKAGFLKLKNKIKNPSKEKNNVTTKDLEQIEKEFPRDYKNLLSKYQKIVYDEYFSKKEIIFFNANTSSKPKPRQDGSIGEQGIPAARGNLETIMRVKKEDIGIQEIGGRGIAVKIRYKP